MYRNNSMNLNSVFTKRPDARAVIRGSREYPDINGVVRFYGTSKGVVVSAQITGLPDSETKCRNPIFGFHIHSGSRCSGNSQDPFAFVYAHYNPEDCPHPFHAGDMPPLFGNKGNAFSAFLTDRFTIGEIIGRTVIIHSSPDDFTSQPGGNAGQKIACGEIIR